MYVRRGDAEMKFIAMSANGQLGIRSDAITART